MADARIDGLTAYAHVADVGRSIEFYRHLGLEVASTHEADGKLVWALVTNASDDPHTAGARLMLAQASGPIEAESQAVLFYCWTPDVKQLHERLLDAKLGVGALSTPIYMPAGEFRVHDPDGYVILVGEPD